MCAGVTKWIEWRGLPASLQVDVPRTSPQKGLGGRDLGLGLLTSR